MDDGSRLRILRKEKSSLMPRRGGRVRSVPGLALTTVIHRGPGQATLTVTGEIDIATAAQLEEQLSALASAGDALVADLTQVTFIDAAGLRVLGRAAAQAATNGLTLRVACGQDHILRLFQLTGLDRRLTVTPTLAQALQSLTPEQR
jgi:anti-sigma B factor antagonist